MEYYGHNNIHINYGYKIDMNKSRFIVLITWIHWSIYGIYGKMPCRWISDNPWSNESRMEIMELHGKHHGNLLVFQGLHPNNG
jgi:hypothetical protein